jgi:hypothetical protein
VRHPIDETRVYLPEVQQSSKHLPKILNTDRCTMRAAESGILGGKGGSRRLTQRVPSCIRRTAVLLERVWVIQVIPAAIILCTESTDR